MNHQSTTRQDRPLIIGVLALQGAFEAHAKALTALGVTAKLVRTPAELADLDGLIIPGGESTTFLKFLERGGFLHALQSFVETTPTSNLVAAIFVVVFGFLFVTVASRIVREMGSLSGGGALRRRSMDSSLLH